MSTRSHTVRLGLLALAILAGLALQKVEGGEVAHCASKAELSAPA
jgi:hypothetical protein